MGSTHSASTPDPGRTEVGTYSLSVSELDESAGSSALSASHVSKLEAAAILHDVGYALSFHRADFHPVDSARYVYRVTGNQVLASLIAHHSHAGAETRLRGLTRTMGQFEEPDPVLT